MRNTPFPWKRAFTGLALLALVGCASTPAPTTALLTYETKPEGATLFEGGASIGVAPVTRTYTAQAGAATVRTPVVTAVWPSGARETYYTLLPVGSDRVATIERPAAAAGLQADIDHGKRTALEREQAQKRSKDAALRDQKRDSERCRKQQSGESKAVQDDC
jgi:type IV pilus biogenesis protein CpaD/CtpE